jgi:hypothetical protein
VKSLNYAILIQDQSEEDQLNYSLRQCESTVTTYSSLEELWSCLFSNTPNAVIVDIRLFNNEDRFLKDHPLVKDNTISLIPFYRDSDGPILKNIPEDTFYDQIKMSPSYELVCRQISKRLQRIRELELDRSDLSQKLEVREKELASHQKKFYQLRSEEAVKTVAYLFSKRFFHQFRITKNFLSALSHTIEDFSFIEEFILFEVDGQRQRIKTINLSEKSTSIPSILSEESLTDSYFKSYVTKTCGSIVRDIFGRHTLIIKIESMPGKTKYVVGFKVQSAYMGHVDNEFLSKVLSGELQRFTSPEFVGSSVKPLHELIPIAERIKKNIDHRHVMYQIDLQALKSSVNNFHEFHWNSFFNDLIVGINQTLNGRSSIFADGINSIYLVCDYSIEIKEVMLFLNDIMTWSYFESEDTSIGKLIDFPLRQINLKDECLGKILGVGPNNYRQLKENKSNSFHQGTVDVL